MTIFQSFRSTVAPFLSRDAWKNLKFLVDPVTGAPAGIESPNANGPHGVWAPIDLTAAQIASPTALMLADLNATYRLNVAPYTRYVSNGTTLTSTSSASALTPTSIDNILFADQFASIQAAIDALPAGGGMVALPPNTTYTITTAISSSTANVHLWAPSWSTVIKRGAALAGTMLQLSGAGCLIEGMTFDGNGSVNITGSAEAQISGANSRITNAQVINPAGTICIAASGAGCRVDHCTITGMGTSLSTQRGYGVWAVNHVQVTIDHNRITGTGIDAIGADGAGTVIANNYISGCHCYTGGPGGQMVFYANTAADAGGIIADNYVAQGGGTLTSGGLELYGDNLTVKGNTVIDQYGQGIGLDGGKGFTVTGNTIMNCGQDATGNQDGISVAANVTDFVIAGNRSADDQGSPTMRWPININSGTSDRYAVTGNDCQPSNRPNGPISDGGTGVNKVIAHNLGMDNVILNSLASAATLTVPPNPNIYLAGSVGVTAVNGSLWVGRVVTFWPQGAVVFTAGATIGNTVTCVANGPPVVGRFDGTKLWLA